jgi:hypothetical protein
MEALSRVFREPTEVIVVANMGSPSWSGIIERARWDPYTQHFLQTECLGAQLNFVGRVRFWFAALVFDGNHTRPCRSPSGRVKLDHVCPPSEA